MKKITDYTLYRWRFKIAFTFLITISLALIILSLFYAPAGLRTAEIEQVSQLDFYHILKENPIDFIYKIIQLSIIKLFGLNILTIKSVSLFFGILTLIILFLIIKSTINKKNAIISTLLIITTSHFFFIIQDGTPQIMLFFWQALLLLLAVTINKIISNNALINQQTIDSKLISFIPIIGAVTGFSLYTPMVFFFIVGLLLTALIHPKIRLFFHKIPFKLFIPGIITLILIIAPLLLQFLKNPDLIPVFFGMSTDQNVFWETLMNLICFWNKNGQLFFQPLFNFGSLLLISIGTFATIKEHFTVKNTAILSILIVSLITNLLNTDYILLLFIPFSLLLANGIYYLIHSWMTIFPFNPYPRVIGTIIMITMTTALITSSLNTLFKEYAYNPYLNRLFTNDLRLLKMELKRNPEALIVVGNDTEFNFLEQSALIKKNLRRVDSINTQPKNAIYTRKAFNRSNQIVPKVILTNHLLKEADRFYVY